MNRTAPALFAMNPAAQDKLEKAFNEGALNCPDLDDGQPSPLVLRYGDEENDYINVNFENGEVVVRDGNDPTGEAHKFPEDQWRSYTGQPSREEAGRQLKEQQAKDGVGLEGLKTGEVDDRTKSPEDN